MNIVEKGKVAASADWCVDQILAHWSWTPEQLAAFMACDVRAVRYWQSGERKPTGKLLHQITNLMEAIQLQNQIASDAARIDRFEKRWAKLEQLGLSRDSAMIIAEAMRRGEKYEASGGEPVYELDVNESVLAAVGKMIERMLNALAKG